MDILGVDVPEIIQPNIVLGNTKSPEHYPTLKTPTGVATMSRFLRKQLGLTLADVSERSHEVANESGNPHVSISVTQLSRAERRESQLTGEKIYGLAKVYGVGMCTIFGGDAEPGRGEF